MFARSATLCACVKSLLALCHQTWLVEIKRDLNAGRLPPGFYALPSRSLADSGPTC